jgi:5-methylcytosine-specific restriction endonuclease McrA
VKTNPETRQRIFAKTNGRCHLTGRQLAFNNYGKPGRRGGWEIEHSIPRAAGGTDHMNNLYPATIAANRSKQDTHTRSLRRRNGLSRAPMSVAQQEQARTRNQWGGLGIGALIGLPFGPLGVGLCAFVGVLIATDAEVG